MAIEDPLGPVDPYAGMLPDWTDEHEALFQQMMGAPAPTSGVQQVSAPEYPVGTILPTLLPGPANPPPPPPPPDPPPAPTPPKSTKGPRGREAFGLGANPTYDEIAAPPSLDVLSGRTEAVPIDPYSDNAGLRKAAGVPSDAANVVTADGVYPVTSAPPGSLNADAVSGGLTDDQAAHVLGKTDDAGAPNIGGPGDMPDEYLSDTELGTKRANTETEEQYRARVEAENQAKAHLYNAGIIKASRQRMEDEQRAHDAYIAAVQKAAADREALEADAKKIATMDPSHWVKSRSTLQSMAAFASVVVGGLAQGAGARSNVGLDMLNKAIDDDNAAQTQNIAGQRADIARRGNSITSALADAGEVHRTNALYANAVYEAAIGDLTTRMQDYDHRGTAANAIEAQIRGVRAAQAANLEAYQAARLKNHLDVEKAYQEQQRIDNALRHDLVMEGQSAAKLAGKGTGLGTVDHSDTAYTIPTSLFNPFNKDEELKAKVPIVGKGAEAGVFKKVDDAVHVYGHVQDYWADLERAAQKAGADKSASEQVWAARKSTDAAEYDAAREAMVVYLTKELGDKLTKGQLDLQMHRVPERASLFEARDPLKQIHDAQEQADRDFMRELNGYGVDSTSVIAGARKMRAPAPLPAPVDELSAAQQARAAAKTPKDIKDTEAELAAAKARVAAESDQKFQGTEAIKEAEHVTTLPPALDELPGLDDATKGRNEALDTFKQTTTAFRKLDDTDPAKGLKLPGDIAKAKADHDAARAAAALKVAQAHKAYDRAQSELETKAVDVAAKDWQRMPVQTVRALAQTAGIDTSKYSDDNLIQTLAEDPRFKLGKNSLPDRLRKLPASERHAVVDLLYAKKPITGSYKPHRIGEGPSIEDPNDLPIPYGAK